MQAIAMKGDFSFTLTWGYYMLAWSHFHAHNLGMALAEFRLAAENTYSGNTKVSVDVLVGLALTYQAMGRRDDAITTINQLVAFAREMDDPACLSAARSCLARLNLAQGNLKAALHWADTFEAKPEPWSLFFWLEIPSITHVKVLIAHGSEGSLLKAIELLKTLGKLVQTWRFIGHSVDVAVLQTIALEKQGHTAEALNVLEAVIALSGPRGWIRPYIEAGPLMVGLLKKLHRRHPSNAYVDSLIQTLLDEKQPAQEKTDDRSLAVPRNPLTSSEHPQASVDPLTNRELDVLELLAERFQTKEITDKLSISTETVKSHLKSIYQKLNTTNRRQAVEIAKRIKLLHAK